MSEKLALSFLPARVQALKDNKSIKNSRVLIGLSKLNEKNPAAADALIQEIEGGKSVSVALVNEVRGLHRKKRDALNESVKLSDLPARVLQPISSSENSVPAEHIAESLKVGASDFPRRAEHLEKAKHSRKKMVSEIARLIGVPEDLPPEDLLEAFAEAYAKLVGEREPSVSA